MTAPTAPDAPPPSPQPGTEPLAGSEAGPARAALQVLGSVVAPATLVGALMYFFGRLHATSFFAYLGVHFTVLDLTTFDFLVRSQDGLFLPLAIAGLGALLILWARRVIVPRLPVRVRDLWRRAEDPLAVVAGCAGLGIALVGVLAPDAFAVPAVAPGLGLACGIALLARTVRPVERTGPTTTAVLEWTAVFVLVSVGLFWAVANYSAALGTSRAMEFERVLDSRPTVSVVSGTSLGLSGVRSTPCADGTSVRYDDLVLVLQAGGHYLLLPSGWTRDNGPAIVLPRSEALRLEFRVAAAAGGAC